MATAAQSDSVLELYSAYFNRAADATGLTFWKNSFDTFLAGADATATDAAKELFALQKIAEDMSAATEYVALYPATQTTTEFVTAVYTNLLNRAFDQEGLDFWVGKIDDNSLTKEGAIVAIIDGAKANTTDQGKLDAALIANKNTVSKYFAETLASNDLTVAAAAFTGVTNDAATVTTANAALDAAVANASATALTKETDSFVGTANDDTFTSANDTLQTTDSIIDTSATDADVLNLESLIYDDNIAPTIIKVETINVNAQTNSVGINLASVSGTSVVNLNTSVAGGTAEVKELSSTKAASIVAGANIATLNIKTATSGTANINIDAGSATTLSLAGDAAKDSAYAVTLGTDIKAISLTAGAGTVDTFLLNIKGTVSTGASLTTDNGLIEKLVIDTGTGTAASIFNLGTAANFVVGQTTATNSSALTLLGDQDVTFMGSGAALTGVKVIDANTGTSTFKANATVATVDLSAAQFDVVDIAKSIAITRLTVNNDTSVKLSVANTAAGVKLATLDSGSLTVDLGANQNILTVEGYATGAVNTVTNLTALTLTNTTAATTISSLVLTNTTTTTLTGDKDLTITSLTGTSATATHFDASAFTGTLKIGAISTGAKVTGGAGADSITGGNAADEIDGGAGDDFLYALGTAATTAGTGKMTGGAGSDTFVINGSGVTVSDFVVADDTLQISLTTADTTTGTLGLVDGAGADVSTSSGFFLTTVTSTASTGTLSAAQAVIVLSGETYAASTDVETAIEVGGTRALTLTTAAANENIIVVWNKTDGSAVVSTVNITTATATATITAANSTVTDLVTLTGVDATTLTAADFDFIA